MIWSRVKFMYRKGNKNSEKLENVCLQGVGNFGFNRYQINWLNGLVGSTAVGRAGTSYALD